MIPLRLEVDMPSLVEPFITRLVKSKDYTDEFSQYGLDSSLIKRSGDWEIYESSGFELKVRVPEIDCIQNDVILVLPGKETAHRLIRGTSKHNTFLITEQCDQLCIMCSQPPKKHHLDLFDSYFEACLVAPEKATIGLSGGEPLLYKEKVLNLIEAVLHERPDLRFHILTNAQNIDQLDIARLSNPVMEKIMWGVPVYSSDPEIHDKVVGKNGAFKKLEESFEIMLEAGSRIELRTVVLKSNAANLPFLADYVSRCLPFIDSWAMMQLERIGYGKLNWEKEFFDNSVDFEPIARAIDISSVRGIDVRLYNFPLCTIPEQWRPYSVSSISDWKRAYIDTCKSCSSIAKCGGFFSWYRHDSGFSRVVAL